MEERILVKEVLEQALQEKRMSIARLAELTDIPERYVAALIEGGEYELPPAPYVRGYLLRMATALGLDGQQIWSAYVKQQELKTSGEGDTLPVNRFALKRVGGKILGIIFAIVVFTLIAGWAIKAVIIREEIDIQSPMEDGVVMFDQTIDLRGKIDPGERLTINGESVAVDRNGYFEKNISLEPGINMIEFKAKRLLGKERTVVRRIIYQQ